MLDTDQLRSFIAIVDTGSFTRAAERVNKTQSAVSMQIRRLEELLGKQLFHKNGRGVRLSRDGQKLIDHARLMLKAEAEALQAMTGKGITGRIRLGIPDDYTDTILVDVMASFSLHHPLVKVQVICQGSTMLTQMTRQNELDLSVITVDSPADDIEILREEPLCWAACREAMNNQYSLKNRHPLPVALGDTHCVWSRDAMASLQDAGIDAIQVLVSSSYAAIGPIVEAGLAVTVFPESLLRQRRSTLSTLSGFPALPNTRLGLLKAPASDFDEISKMADLIRQTLRRETT